MKKLLVLTCLSSSLVLCGCAPILIGSAAVGGTAVAVDRRTVGDVTNDGVIETKASVQLARANFSSSHITVTAYEGRVLLTGEVGSEDDKEKAGEIVKSINGVTTVFNELAVMNNVPFTTRMNDSLTASKVRAALLDNKDVTLTSLKVTVDRGIAYLMGTVTKQEADIITAITAKVPGVVKVVTLMEIISPEELAKRKINIQSSSPASPVTETVEVQSGAETIPIK